MTRTLFAVAFVLTSLPAFAQAPGGGGRGSAQDQRACAPDARKLCRSSLGDDMAVLRCFQSNRSKLSRACRAVLTKYGQ
jgi:hypothetical protein